MKLQRRGFLKACTAGMATLVSGRLGAVLQAAGKPATAKPNIVFILTDDLGYADLSCYGASNTRTPNLNRMAAEGLRLTDVTPRQASAPRPARR